MKKTLNIGIGGKSFIIDEDAHERLSNYLATFRSRLTGEQGSEVMDDIEARIAELESKNAALKARIAELEGLLAQKGGRR